MSFGQAARPCVSQAHGPDHTEAQRWLSPLTWRFSPSICPSSPSAPSSWPSASPSPSPHVSPRRPQAIHPSAHRASPPHAYRHSRRSVAATRVVRAPPRRPPRLPVAAPVAGARTSNVTPGAHVLCSGSVKRLRGSSTSNDPRPPRFIITPAPASPDLLVHDTLRRRPPESSFLAPPPHAATVAGH